MAKAIVKLPQKPGDTYTFPEARLLAARYMPYFRGSTINLIPTVAKGLKSIAVDSSMRCYFDPDEFQNVPLEEAAGSILVEVTKGVLNMAGRAVQFLGSAPSKREIKLWNKAVNIVVNQILRHAKVPLPAGAINHREYGLPDNLLVTEYFVKLDELEPEEEEGDDGDGQGQGDGEGEGQGQDSDQPGGDGSRQQDPGTGKDGGGSCGDNQQKDWEQEKENKQNPGLDDHEQEMLRRQAAKACEEHERVKGKGSMAGYLVKFTRDVLRPRADPVRELLAQVKFAINSTSGHGDYTWKKLNRRTPPGGIRLPAHIQPIPKILVAIDTSGSMAEQDLALALGVVGQVIKALPSQGVTVVAGDTHLASVGKYFRPEQVVLAGGGGTDMARLLVEAANVERPPDAIILATDGETGWPSSPIGPKVVAAITRRNRSYPVPDWISVVEIDPREEE